MGKPKGQEQRGHKDWELEHKLAERPGEAADAERARRLTASLIARRLQAAAEAEPANRASDNQAELASAELAGKGGG
jgi:hypothetical protein